jgi:hypothetical protein
LHDLATSYLTYLFVRVEGSGNSLLYNNDNLACCKGGTSSSSALRR